PVLGDPRPPEPHRSHPPHRPGPVGDAPAERVPVPHAVLEGGRGVRGGNAGLFGRVLRRTPLPLSPSCEGEPVDPGPGTPEPPHGALMTIPTPLTGVVPPVCTPL